MSEDRATQAYWEELWRDHGVPKAFKPLDEDVTQYPQLALYRLLKKILPQQRVRLLEVGCGASPWLPVFSKHFNYEAVGIDYSQAGCDSARKLLFAESTSANVYCVDLFNPPLEMIASFDVVVSFGVVEHFDPVSECIQAIAQFLKPGGLIFTEVPNLAGHLGLIQKVINEPVFRKHVVLKASDLREAHLAANLEVLFSRYFMFSNFGVCNLNEIQSRGVSWLLKKISLALLSRISQLSWVVERNIVQLPVTRQFSPYIVCLARRK